jgi:hypothetical protein
VSIDRISILADRGDLAFVELDCAACGSRTMSLVLQAGSGAGEPVLDTAAHPELGPLVDARLAGRPAIGEDDVVAVARLLATWDGDLRTLLEGRRDGPPEPAG